MRECFRHLLVELWGEYLSNSSQDRRLTHLPALPSWRQAKTPHLVAISLSTGLTSPAEKSPQHTAELAEKKPHGKQIYDILQPGKKIHYSGLSIARHFREFYMSAELCQILQGHYLKGHWEGDRSGPRQVLGGLPFLLDINPHKYIDTRFPHKTNAM